MPGGRRRRFLSLFFFAIAPIKHLPFGRSLDHATLEAGDFPADRGINLIAFLGPFGQQFASLPQSEAEVVYFGQTFFLETVERLASKKKYTGFA